MQNCIIANFDKKEYISPQRCGEDSTLKAVYLSYEGILQILAILLADGNGRGGGDLITESELIGSWKGCRIALIDEVVTDSKLSEPGLEDTPLHKQITSLGTDITERVIEVFDGTGEGTLASLSLNSTLPLSIQRNMPSEARGMLSSIATRKGAIPDLASFVGFFGAQPGISRYWLQKRFEKGLIEFAETTGQPQRYTVKDFSWKKGVVEPLIPPEYPRPDRISTTEISFGLVAEGKTRAKRFTVKFGKGGSSFEDTILSIFPGFKFDAAPTASTSEMSPEVANVLKALQQIKPEEA